MCKVADTPGGVVGLFVRSKPIPDIDEGSDDDMSKQVVRIRLKAYDHRILDNACSKIVEAVKRSGGEISGPVPLPTEIEKFTILRADIKNPGKEVIDVLTHLDLPSGVDIDIKQNK